MDVDDGRIETQNRDRLEILERVVKRMGRGERVDDETRIAAEQDGVAVGLCARDCGGAERTAGAAHVLDDDGAKMLLHLVRPGTTGGVVKAAWRIGDH